MAMAMQQSTIASDGVLHDRDAQISLFSVRMTKYNSPQVCVV